MHPSPFVPTPPASPRGPTGSPALFDPGALYITPAAKSTLQQLGIDPLTLFFRHMHGDWGELSEDDALANALAVEDGECIVSSYLLHGQRGVELKASVVWIISASSDSARNTQRPYSTMVLPGEASSNSETEH